jgi:hypothetical protein
VAVEAFDGRGRAGRKGGITMAVLERNVLKLRDGGEWDDFIAYCKRWDAFAEKHSFPPAARYRYDYGTQPWGTVVVEYRWKDMSELAAKWASFWADPESQPFGAQFFQVYETLQRELLFTIEELE